MNHYCQGVDGQVFGNLSSGSYTLFIEARAIENTNEVAYDTAGPVILAAGANASISEAIGKNTHLLATHTYFIIIMI